MKKSFFLFATLVCFSGNIFGMNEKMNEKRKGRIIHFEENMFLQKPTNSVASEPLQTAPPSTILKIPQKQAIETEIILKIPPEPKKSRCSCLQNLCCFQEKDGCFPCSDYNQNNQTSMMVLFDQLKKSCDCQNNYKKTCGTWWSACIFGCTCFSATSLSLIAIVTLFAGIG